MNRIMIAHSQDFRVEPPASSQGSRDERQSRLLDAALVETFPASDAVSVAYID